ncbi:MAG: zinc-binding dehydrogenase [Guyparkeria sp.]
MDSALLAEARRINRRLFGHIRLTIPSVLATDERFALRITVFDPTAMPDTDFAGELCFAPSPGIEGLPERLRLGPDDGGVARIDGLRATGDPVARVLASIDGVDLCSNPAWVSDDPPYRVFWGDLHVHTTASTCQQWACKSPHFAYAYAQEVAHLDFCAVADHLRGLARDADRWPTLQELARRYGADLVIDYTKQDPVEAIMDATDGQGVDSAIEALGRDETFQGCINATRAGGTISNIGYHGEGDFVHIPRMGWGVGMSDKTITTGLCPGGSARMKRLMRLIHAGRVDPTLMTTHRFGFDDIEKAFRMMQTKEDNIIKPLIEFR